MVAVVFTPARQRGRNRTKIFLQRQSQLRRTEYNVIHDTRHSISRSPWYLASVDIPYKARLTYWGIPPANQTFGSNWWIKLMDGWFVGNTARSRAPWRHHIHLMNASLLLQRKMVYQRVFSSALTSRSTGIDPAVLSSSGSPKKSLRQVWHPIKKKGYNKYRFPTPWNKLAGKIFFHSLLGKLEASSGKFKVFPFLGGEEYVLYFPQVLVSKCWPACFCFFLN